MIGVRDGREWEHDVCGAEPGGNAGAQRAEVRIGHDSGRRFVHVSDDGQGFDPGAGGAGQGLKNIRRRAESIQGAFELHTRPGWGTALQVVLRN